VIKDSEIQTEKSDDQTTAELLTPEERLVCEGVAAAGEAPWSQRAQALLAVNHGDSPAVAGESSGLQENQVKYWINAFRRKRTDIFPEYVIKGIEVDSAASTADIPAEEATSVESPGKTTKTKKKNKKSKSKQAKSSKKTKNKGKKSKNGKGKKKKKK